MAESCPCDGSRVNGYFYTGHVTHVLVFIVRLYVYATTQLSCIRVSKQCFNSLDPAPYSQDGMNSPRKQGKRGYGRHHDVWLVLLIEVVEQVYNKNNNYPNKRLTTNTGYHV